MHDKLLESIGMKVKELRLEKHFTQEKLAYLCQTDASYIRKVESGKVNISVKRLYKITEELDVTLSEIFEDL